MNIVFLGTPDFAVAALDHILAAGFNVVAVVTTPDKPAGRGLKPTFSAVKQYALTKNLPLLQPENLKSDEFFNALDDYHPDLQVVVAFRMLPEKIWNYPPLGTINLHASLLPQYRGAAPIHWAIMNGETETGLTTFKLQHAIDTGHILDQIKVPIPPHIQLGELYDEMKIKGAQLLVQTLHSIQNGTATPRPQNINTDEPLHLAPKIQTHHTRIDWTQKGSTIINQIRGLSPHPSAYCMFNDKHIKIFTAHFHHQSNISPECIGNFYKEHNKVIKVACCDGYVILQNIQIEGKKRMPIEDVLRGQGNIFAHL